jgi:hypothetical protein
MNLLVLLIAQFGFIASSLALGSFFPDSSIPKSISSVTGGTKGNGTLSVPGSLRKPGTKQASVTEVEFNARIDEIESYYAPVYLGLGVRLDLQRDWNDPTVNASASKDGKNWVIQVFGGLARELTMTPDAFTLVLCHEIGHHLGGFPFKNETTASEGQADYYATQVCARNLWNNSNNEKALKGLTIDSVAKKKCDTYLDSKQERDLCYRVSVASLELSSLLARLADGKPTSFLATDPTVVETTFKFHPSAQCRLDTFLAGSLCKANFDELLIPGFSPSLNLEEKEKEALGVSCSQFTAGEEIAGRPKCWFKQSINIP